METANRRVLAPTTPARAATATPVRAWAVPATLAILVLTAVLYVWGLDRNGYANSYYSAAVVAGTESWKAFFFGAFDAGSFITVDKPPLALWLMELSTRVFGISSWSILLPEALLGVATVGVATVGVVMDAVRRPFGPVAGLVAGAITALTPVAVLMFRFNNPDALLTFLMVGAGWAMTRALEGGRTRWLLLSAVAVGLAFNTKYLQGYIVLPALLLTYLVFGPPRLGRRLLQLAGAGVVLAVSTGWWMAIVDAIPAGARPFIGGSTNNSVLDLVIGYDGLGRIFGQRRSLSGILSSLFGGSATATASGLGGPGGGGPGFGGAAGLDRLFNAQIAGEISWLLPFAGVVLVAGLWARRRGARADLARAAYVLWGMWLLTHFLVFSFASGIFHSYYTVAMAPAVGALAGAGVVELWRLRAGHRLLAGLLAAAAILPTAWWGYQLLGRTPGFVPALRFVELGLAVVAVVVLLLPRRLAVPDRFAGAALAAGTAAILLGPAAYAVDNVTRSVAGSIPTSGPVASAGLGGPGGGGFTRRFDGNRDFSGRFSGGFDGAFAGGPPPAGAPGQAPTGASAGFAGGAPGGAASSQLVDYLVRNQGGATWLVAVSSANEGASIELSTHRAVLAMGGFSGSDPAMTVARLQQLVSSGQLRYVLVGGMGGRPQGQAQGGQSVSSWVTQSCTPVDYAGTGSTGNLYDCAAGAA